ncbi:MAG: hypothetical protein KDC79_07040 [Cyclobacteriaceae bacterium]|nr:hypothetical protein [Cyclobacteriaceae bacterium]
MKSKHFLQIVLLVALGFFSANCGGTKHEAHETQTEETDSLATAYACPMHPEITGKKGDSCSKCGMLLTEVKPAEKTDSTAHE